MMFPAINKVVLGSIAFGVFWVMAVFPSIPFLPIGRTAGSLLGALLMIIFQVITPSEAYSAINLPILSLLFGTMVVSIYLEKAHMFGYLGRLLSWKSCGSRDLLVRISLISAFASALFNNDTTCIVLTEFVLKYTKQHNIPSLPFLLALASSANIGSSATPIGNPQNLVIAIQSKIHFTKFLLGILPAMLVGIILNTIIILCMYWRSFSLSNKHVDSLNPSESPIIEKTIEMSSPKLSPTKKAHEQLTLDVLDDGEGMTSNTKVGIDVSKDGPEGSITIVTNVVDVGVENKEMKGKKEMFLKVSTYVVTIGMLVAFLLGFDMSWTAIAAAILLIVIHCKDAWPTLEKVSYSLLIFFTGMFIVMYGFNKTGIPSAIWDVVEPLARVNKASGVALLSIVILFLSNFASNVPTVLLLGAEVAKSTAAISALDVDKAWLILAWVSSVAGNLSLIGSAANLIVCEQAHRSEENRYNLTFWKHIYFGFPSTLIVTAAGLPLIRG